MQKVKLPAGYYYTLWWHIRKICKKASARLMIVVPLVLALIFLYAVFYFLICQKRFLILAGNTHECHWRCVCIAVKRNAFSVFQQALALQAVCVAVLNGIVL